MTHNASPYALRPEETIPAEITGSPALLFLYYRIEQILGIRAAGDALSRLNEYLEKSCGASFVESPAAYERVLASRERIFEISQLLTVNETYFFREGTHFSLLMRHFLPRLSMLNRAVQVCSAASSIGCEAYSTAMLLDYYAKNIHRREDGRPFEFAIDAFDISARAIETAQNARYTANTLRADGTDWRYILDSYLIPDGGEFIIAQEIREKVRFFTHNIMRGLGRQYDIIFFRNALIYFSSKNRLVVVNDLAEALFNNGLLFLGVSETSSVKHPLLVNRYLSDVFYFQKAASVFSHEKEVFPAEYPKAALPDSNDGEEPKVRHKRTAPPVEKPPHEHAARPQRQKHAELPVDCAEAAAILEKAEGETNAKKVLDILGDENNGAALSGAELAAAAASFLNRGDFNSASTALSRLEKHNSGAVPKFLRGEYNFLSGSAGEAEKNYEEAAGVDKTFWPALYRLSSLAAGGNRTRYEYRTKKAIESLEQGKGLRYECFIGGFSPDYFRRILERKLTER